MVRTCPFCYSGLLPSGAKHLGSFSHPLAAVRHDARFRSHGRLFSHLRPSQDFFFHFSEAEAWTRTTSHPANLERGVVISVARNTFITATAERKAPFLPFSQLANFDLQRERGLISAFSCKLVERHRFHHVRPAVLPFADPSAAVFCPTPRQGTKYPTSFCPELYNPATEAQPPCFFS